ncbi:LysR substrate-binding domain-containing protein [Novispirillum itersonii]|uniref:LysR substrate-binding domain-containing protein n=1 Tax=Novispirillum itersonii TaxID=189 RepID=UPI000381C43F|nr:LysR substrate-binding domain-containing protein [Novispirillum itersonii]
MRDLETALLRTFVSVADSGGFTRAGGRVNRTQSTVSQQVRRLEEQLGCRLLDRNAHGVTITEAGERLLGYARRILQLNEEALGVFTLPPVETVRIGVTEDFAVEDLPALLMAVKAEMPDVQLEMRTDLSVVLAADLDQGALDIALYKSLTVPTRSVGVYTDWLVWAAAAQTRPELEPVFPLVAFRQGCIYRNHAIQVLEEQGRRWRVAYTSENVSGVLAAIRAGFGVGVLSASAVPADLRALGTDSGLPPLPTAHLVLQTRRSATGGPLGKGAQRMVSLLKSHLDERDRRGLLLHPGPAGAMAVAG